MSQIEEEQTDELASSKLGTLEYWEEAYSKEIENFNEFGDEGEIWFGLQIVKRVVQWIKTHINDKSTPILDLGCGNGFTCCCLAEEGYTNLTGIDYSQKAIDLSRSIAEKKDLNIKYQMVDILDQNQYMNEQFDICVDKGTYDAIGLCPDDPKTKRHLYKQFLECSFKKNATNSLFIITSCNWTKDELLEFFTQDKSIV